MLMDGFNSKDEGVNDLIMSRLHVKIIELCHNNVVGHCGLHGTVSLIRRCNLHFQSLSICVSVRHDC
jgi:hypothetical protein